MNPFEATLRRYISTRDAMLDCMMGRNEFDCQSCKEHGGCETRQAWIDAYNAANDITGPEGEKEERLERFKMAKVWQNEDAELAVTRGGAKTYGISRAERR